MLWCFITYRSIFGLKWISHQIWTFCRFVKCQIVRSEKYFQMIRQPIFWNDFIKTKQMERLRNISCAFDLNPEPQIKYKWTKISFLLHFLNKAFFRHDGRYGNFDGLVSQYWIFRIEHRVPSLVWGIFLGIYLAWGFLKNFFELSGLCLESVRR